ncbi:MAG TPA: hypothetical protein P5081_18200 [Phycisphaerae bacterium]|nr:hypothetical protein [Phycisphaerae bacterium]HRW54804.1 hypothetical protein [Phycisphaerae bacterium]
MLNIVHVTHEAVVKVGGIGTVLEGLITSRAYTESVGRTLLLCPLFTTEGDADSRLGPGGEVLYSSIDARWNDPHREAFGAIQQRFHTEIVYGRRHLRDPISGLEAWPEVALIDVGRIPGDIVNDLKRRLFESFGVESTRYEHSWDYEQYVRLAEPGLAVARALGLATGTSRCVVVGHEFMGIPTALAAKCAHDNAFITAYHAHEVSTARKIVEDHPGHDTSFYNVLRFAERDHMSFGDLYGDQSGYYRHALINATRHLDVTLAVSDYVSQELRRVGPGMEDSNIRLCYNGVPAYRVEPKDAAQSKRLLQTYAETLLGERPHHIFTHVTRMTPSKGLWRDINVMYEIEKAFRRTGESAVLFVLSTELAGARSREDVRHMEKWWDWPVAHREGVPDLSGGEALFYQAVQAFNARSRQCKILFINQFGFNRALCGERMPSEMQFVDIRRGSDVEFGQSIYEPFGIAQVEALSFGAICALSDACGCGKFVERAAGSSGTKNVIVADYAGFRHVPDTIDAYMHLSGAAREAHEASVARDVADEIVNRLPRTPRDKEACIVRGYELASRMSWDVVARDYFLPAIDGVASPNEMLV